MKKFVSNAIKNTVIGAASVTFFVSGVRWDGQEILKEVEETLDHFVNQIYELNNDRSYLINRVEELQDQLGSSPEVIRGLEKDLQTANTDATDLGSRAQEKKEAVDAMGENRPELPGYDDESYDRDEPYDDTDTGDEAVDNYYQVGQGYIAGVRQRIQDALIPGLSSPEIFLLSTTHYSHYTYRIEGDGNWTSNWSNIQRVIDAFVALNGVSHAWFVSSGIQHRGYIVAARN